MTVRRRLLACCLLLAAAGCGHSTAYWADEARSVEPLRRLHAIHALGERTSEGVSVIPVLVEALKDENTYVRRDAARALGHFGADAREAVPALRGCVKDREPSVRKAAAQALQEINASAAPPGKVRS
jgi:HEAT repeat protein